MTSPRWPRNPWPMRTAIGAAVIFAAIALGASYSGFRDRTARNNALSLADSLNATLKDSHYHLTLARLNAGRAREQFDSLKRREAASDARYVVIDRRLQAITAQLASMPLQTAPDTLAAFPVLVARCNQCDSARAELAEGKRLADSAATTAKEEAQASARADSVSSARNTALERVRQDLASSLAKSEPPCRSGIPFLKCPSRKASLVIGIVLTEAVHLASNRWQR